MLPKHRVGAEGDSDFELVSDLDAEKLRCGYADNRKDPAVQPNGPGGNRGVLCELGLPEGIPDHGGRRAAPGPVVFAGEDTPNNRPCAQCAEEVSADEEAVGIPRL